MDAVVVPGFDAAAPTLFAGSLNDGAHLVQVCGLSLEPTGTCCRSRSMPSMLWQLAALVVTHLRGRHQAGASAAPHAGRALLPPRCQPQHGYERDRMCCTCHFLCSVAVVGMSGGTLAAIALASLRNEASCMAVAHCWHLHVLIAAHLMPVSNGSLLLICGTYGGELEVLHLSSRRDELSPILCVKLGSRAPYCLRADASTQRRCRRASVPCRCQVLCSCWSGSAAVLCSWASCLVSSLQLLD